MLSKVKKVINIIIIVILLIILFVCGTILVNSYIHPEEVPSFFGWKPFIVLSGSMQAEIDPGDIVVVQEVDTSTLQVGDIIAYKTDDDIVITHRIVDIVEDEGETKLVTKGDNNNANDSNYVELSQVEGIYKFKVSRLGNLAIFIQTPTGIISCLSVPILILIIIQFVDMRRDKKYMAEKVDKEEEMAKQIEELKKQNEELKKKE